MFDKLTCSVWFIDESPCAILAFGLDIFALIMQICMKY